MEIFAKSLINYMKECKPKRISGRSLLSLYGTKYSRMDQVKSA